MDFVQMRELVRVRHELRLARTEGRQAEARLLLQRMRALAEQDPIEAAEVHSELCRWESSLGL